MAALTIQDKVEIVRLCGYNDRSEREVTEIFNRRHPDRRICCSAVHKIKKVFIETGAVTKRI